MAADEEPAMQYLFSDDVWQIDQDRRTRLRAEFSRLRRPRPRPPVDHLPPPPSTGGLPPAA